MKKDTCKHYKSPMMCGMEYNYFCEADVDYRTFTDFVTPGWLRRLPCAGANECSRKCDKFNPPTAEELEADEAEVEKLLADIEIARASILEYAGNSPGGGSLECPICKTGFLAYRVNEPGPMSAAHGSGYHVHAKCSTAGCVSWME